MRWLAALFAVLLLLLQYRVWLSSDGVREVLRLEQGVEQQQAENARLLERNRQLAAEVRDLKQGYAALEERARTDLGMIANNETFYQVVPSSVPSSMPSSAPSSLVPLPSTPSSSAAHPRAAAASAPAARLPAKLRDRVAQRGAAARE